LFFVLSGFLITSILLGLRNEKHYFTIFYSRRALRIFPPYFLALAVYIAISFALGAPGTWSLWARFIFYYSSLYVRGPFLLNGTPAKLPPIVMQSMGVLWSHSVEEIYYTFWAPVVRFMNESVIRAILITAAISAPLLRLWLGGATMTFYGGMDGLAYGSAVALLVHSRRQAPHACFRADRIFDLATIIYSCPAVRDLLGGA
jgi:peptidoglycan/LPS O-acetylase OafA/YrhL